MQLVSIRLGRRREEGEKKPTEKTKVVSTFDRFFAMPGVKSICQHIRESREEKKKSYLAITARALPLRAPLCVNTKSDGRKTAREGYGIGGLHNEDRRIQAHFHILSLVSSPD